jgi:hypothetical protein
MAASASCHWGVKLDSIFNTMACHSRISSGASAGVGWAVASKMVWEALFHQAAASARVDKRMSASG